MGHNLRHRYAMLLSLVRHGPARVQVAWATLVQLRGSPRGLWSLVDDKGKKAVGLTREA